ncbi:hypothetical protein ACQZV8_03590 [Magnetococcales bacterium HHB-1]
MNAIVYDSLLVVIVLIAVVWLLLKLREIRERTTFEDMPNDEVTLILGLFFTLSRACIEYYREHKSYPSVISGAHDGLVESGYLEADQLTPMVSVIPMFTMVTTTKSGHGICLPNASVRMVHSILERVAEGRSDIRFMDYRESRFQELDYPVSTEHVNLTMPLPLNPHDRRPVAKPQRSSSRRNPPAV